MWPLDPEHERLVRELAGLIASGGVWRFMRGHVAAANRRDYPDPWQETRNGVARALARTLWHARLDLVLTLEDVRQPGLVHGDRLRKTALELVRIDDTGGDIALEAVGNDDVAGILATEVGRAFVAHLARQGHPLRSASTDELPDASTGTLAAVYLGLGVVATNASRYRRAVGEIIGRTAYHEHDVVQIGGLDPDALAFLIAVQATVRDDVLHALDTLAPSHAKAVATWREVLDDHEDELRVLLGIDDDTLASAVAPTRLEVPRPVSIKATWAEEDLDKHNHGGRVYRFPETTAWTTAPLGAVGGFVLALPLVMFAGVVVTMIALPSVGFVGGFVYGLRRKQLRCTACGCFLTADAVTCRLCGGTIAGDVKSVNEARDREEALDEDIDEDEPPE